VAPTTRNGIIFDPGTRFDVTRERDSYSGVSVGDALARSLLLASISTWSARSPRASSIMDRMSSALWSGSVRMSTSSSTVSGITFVLTPPRITVGANVVWVAAWIILAIPRSSVDSQNARMFAGSRSIAVISLWMSASSRNLFQTSCTLVSA
jgi:hypothetical protein